MGVARKKGRAKRPVLAAIDFSPCSAKALIWAAKAAGKLEAPLVALHVVHDPESAPGYYVRSKKHGKHLKRIEEAAAEMMEEFLAKAAEARPNLFSGLEQRLVAGLPVNRILEVAEEINAQLIVMGSRGRTGLPHVLLGSKAEKVVQLSPIPVTIVKDGTNKK